MGCGSRSRKLAVVDASSNGETHDVDCLRVLMPANMKKSEGAPYQAAEQAHEVTEASTHTHPWNYTLELRMHNGCSGVQSLVVSGNDELWSTDLTMPGYENRAGEACP